MNDRSVFTRILSLSLSAIMLLGIFSCADTGEKKPQDTTSAVTEAVTEDPYPDDLPETMDFEGQKIRFIVGTGGADEGDRSVDIDEAENDTGDIINEAIWKRNQLIEQRLNVDIELTSNPGYADIVTSVGTFVQANSDDYELIVGHARFNIQFAANGYLKNLNNVENVDFEKNYWSQMYMDEIAYMNNHYWATGDITLSYISTIYCMYVNSAVWSDFYQDDTIYNVVNEGRWTLDSLKEYSVGVYLDVNGNSEPDDSDTFGFAMQQGHVLNGMAFASNVNYSDRDNDGNISIVVNSEHTIDVFNKLYNLFYESGNATHIIPNDQYDATALAMFVDNRLLFFPATFGVCENEKMRAMETDYFIIPLPKYDEAQEKYMVNQYDGVPLYGIPITCGLDKLDAIGATMEALGSMTYSLVTPVYYDLALKNKYSRDEESANMLDLIHDSITTDFAFTWGDSVGGMLNLFYDNIKNAKFSSVIARQTKTWEKNLETLLTKLDKYADM